MSVPFSLTLYPKEKLRNFLLQNFPEDTAALTDNRKEIRRLKTQLPLPVRVKEICLPGFNFFKAIRTYFSQKSAPKNSCFLRRKQESSNNFAPKSKTINDVYNKALNLSYTSSFKRRRFTGYPSLSSGHTPLSIRKQFFQLNTDAFTS